MDHRRVFGLARRHARLAVTMLAVAAMAAGVTVAVLPRDEGTRQPAGILPPGSMGSLPSPHAWWDPRGWAGGHAQPPKPRHISAIGGPHRTRMPRARAAAGGGAQAPAGPGADRPPDGERA